MYRALLTASFALALGTAISPASAEVRSCVTINGKEDCHTAQHSLVCTTVNGKTTCVVDGKMVEMTESGSSDGNVVIEKITPDRKKMPHARGRTHSDAEDEDDDLD